MGARLSELSGPQHCSGESGGPGWNGLTSKEKHAIKKTMKKLSENVSENGQQLFLKFFQTFPAYKDYFSSFRGMQVEELKGSIVLRAHGTMVIHTLSTIIDKIDDYHVFRTTLHTNIRSHFKRGVRIHNYEAMFGVFANFLQEKFGDSLDVMTRRAWDKVACMILEVMRDAIMEQGIIASICTKEALQQEQDAIELRRHVLNNVDTITEEKSKDADLSYVDDDDDEYGEKFMDCTDNESQSLYPKEMHLVGHDAGRRSHMIVNGLGHSLPISTSVLAVGHSTGNLAEASNASHPD